MMNYFVTGGTGFIGRFVMSRLLARGATVHVLVREQSVQKLVDLRENLGVDEKQIKAVVGDLTAPSLGLDKKTLKQLSGKIDHFFHLAAIYDMSASEESQQAANIDGTRAAVAAAEALGAGIFHHVSSIAVAVCLKALSVKTCLPRPVNWTILTFALNTSLSGWCATSAKCRSVSTALVW